MRAFDLVGQARVVAVVFGDIGDLGAGFADDLAGIARLELRQTGCRFLHQIGEPQQKFAARGGRQPCPFGRMERPMRCADGPIDISRIRRGHQGPGSAGGGIEALESPGPILETAIDIVLKAVHLFPCQAKAGITSRISRSSDAFLRSKLMPVSIQKLNSSYPSAS